MNWKQIINDIVKTVAAWVTSTGLKVIIALVLLFISFRIINKFARRIAKQGESGKLDKTLTKVFSYLFTVVLKCVVAICLVGYVGIDTSGLAALVTSLGVCLGLALNGALANLAGGVLIIITRPFKVDDFIEAQGYSGTVEDIRITSTRIRTGDNKVVYIPNGTLSSGCIVNYSEKELRRVDLKFSIAYSNSFSKAKTIIAEICDSHELVLKDPAPIVRMSEHAENSINIVTRVWTKSSDYWTVYFDLLETVKERFDEEGVEIPFNQVDVHIKNN